MTSRILVTGSDGFVGRTLVPLLRAEGHRVVEHCLSDGDLSLACPHFPDVDHVIHLAARTFVPDSWTDPASFYRINVQGTVNILDLCRRTGASATIVSSYVYGVPQYNPIDEGHPLSAVNPYGHTKLLVEQVSAFFRDCLNTKVSIVRPFNLYGAGQSGSFLIPSVIQQALDETRDSIEVLDDTPRRDYLYIDDFASLMSRLVGGPFGVYNAGSGVATSVREIIEIVNSLLPNPKRLICTGASRRNEIPEMRASIERATQALNWSPRTNLREGLRQTLEFTKANVKQSN